MKFKQKNWNRIICNNCGCQKLVVWNNKKDRAKEIIGCPDCGMGFYLNHKKKVGREMQFTVSTPYYIG